MSNEKKVAKCKWCSNDAELSDYRNIDGMVSKIPSCRICFTKSTDYLLKYGGRSCDNCSLQMNDGRCDLDLKDRCITNTRNDNHKDYWIDQNE